MIFHFHLLHYNSAIDMKVSNAPRSNRWSISRLLIKEKQTQNIIILTFGSAK